jgi:hypothetical protein
MKFTSVMASTVLACLCILTYLALAANPWIGDTLSVSEAEARWGKQEFSEESFKTGDAVVRAKMVYSLIKSKKLLGLSASELRSRLGDFDGHYFSESYPTYIVQRGEKKGEDTWQIVFLLDGNRKTKEVIVHKNCCD